MQLDICCKRRGIENEYYGLNVPLFVKRRFAIRTGDGLKSSEIRMAATLLQTRDARTPAVTTLCRCLA